MSDFEDDLSESEVTENTAPKKQGMNIPKVSNTVVLGVALVALLGGVGIWSVLNSGTAPTPDPISQTITTPDQTAPTTPDPTQPITTTDPTQPITTPSTTATGTGVEAGTIPLIADKPKPVVPASTTATTPKPAVKPAPKPIAPKLMNPFAPLPQSGTTAAVTVNAGQGSFTPVNNNPVSFQPTASVSVPRPTATPTIRTQVVSSPFVPRPTTNAGAVAGSGVTTTIKPVPVVVSAQRPVIPRVVVTSTPQTVASKPRPIANTPIARPAFSITPSILASSPRVQPPIQAVTPPSTTSTTGNPSTTPSTTASVPSSNPQLPAVTQTPSSTATTRPTNPEPPIFKIEPAPTTPPATNTTPTTTTPATSTTTPAFTTPTPTAPATNTTTPATPTTPATNTTTPATPVPTDPVVTTPTPTDPVATAPTPVAPSVDLLELRRVVQDDLRLEYAGFSIGTVKKAFFQSNRGLLSVAEGDALIRDSNIILKSVSPTEVVLALGNEILTLPLVKR